jgi:type VI secretion system protein ImpF
MHAFRAAHAARDAKKHLDIRDEAGERVIAGRRTSARVAITEPVLRAEVAKDLVALMNTTNLESIEDLSAAPQVRSSILNYGIPDLVRRSIDELKVESITKEIEEVLSTFEPRLVPQSIRVERDRRVRAGELKVRFMVRADLKCDPVNVPLEFIADVELESGKIKVDRL